MGTAAEGTAAEGTAATLRMFMAGTLWHMAERVSEYMAERASECMAECMAECALEYIRASACAAELAWVAATTAAFGTEPDGVGTAVAGGLTG